MAKRKKSRGDSAGQKKRKVAGKEAAQHSDVTAQHSDVTAQHSDVTARTRHLMAHPVAVDAAEFEGAVVEELHECNMLLTGAKGSAVHKWTKKDTGGGSLKKVKKVADAPLIQLEAKTRASGAEVTEVPDELAGDYGDKKPQSDKKNKGKKEKKQPRVSKQRYDKINLPNNDADDTQKDGADAAPKQLADVSAWKNLNIPEPILKALAEKGFSKPTEIQEKTIGPAISKRCDILGAAETGSGKTLAFVIPMLTGIMADKRRRGEKQRKEERVKQLRAKTMQEKAKRKEVVRFEEDEDEEDEESEFEEASDEEDGVEVYLYNGADGVQEVSYEDFMKGQEAEKGKKRRRRTSKRKSGDSEDEDDDDDMDDGEELDVEDLDDDEIKDEDNELLEEVDEDLDGEEMEEDAEIDEEEDIGIENDDASDAGEEDTDDGEDEGNDEEDADDSNDNDDLGSDGDVSDIDFEEELQDKDQLGSDDEEEVLEDDEEKRGLVCVMNNIEFPFLRKFQKDDGKPKLMGLILTPTRELAVQINAHIQSIGAHCGVNTAVLVGGLDISKQKRVLARKRPEIVIATPGRLWDLIRDDVEYLQDLTSVRYFAIDEADRLIDERNFAEVHKVVRLMNGGDEVEHSARANRQVLVFSATLTMSHQLPDRLQPKDKGARKLSNRLPALAKMVGVRSNALKVDVTREHHTAQGLTEARINCHTLEKDYYLYYFLNRHPGRTMVFCNSIEAIRRLCSLFKLMGFDPQEMHASLHQKQRLKALQRFSEDPAGLLITSDVAARGLDVPHVRHVLHYQVPFTAESYVHRSGRTARGSNPGLSVCLVEPKMAVKFRSISVTLNRSRGTDIPDFPVDENIYEQVVARVDAARELERLLFKRKTSAKERGDAARDAREAGLPAEEEGIDQEDFFLMDPEERRQHMLVKGETKAVKAEIRARRVALEQMLAEPLLGAVFSAKRPLSAAALANILQREQGEVPEGLVGLNPTLDLQQGDIGAKLKQFRKQQSKLTKQFLNPIETEKKKSKIRTENKIKKMQAKAQKRKDKRRAKRGMKPLREQKTEESKKK